MGIHNNKTTPTLSKSNFSFITPTLVHSCVYKLLVISTQHRLAQVQALKKKTKTFKSLKLFAEFDDNLSTYHAQHDGIENICFAITQLKTKLGRPYFPKKNHRPQKYNRPPLF